MKVPKFNLDSVRRWNRRGTGSACEAHRTLAQALAEIERLRDELAIWQRGPTSHQPPIPLTVTDVTLKEG